MAPRSKTLRLLKAQSAAMLLMVSMLLAFNSNVAQAQSGRGNFIINSVELTRFDIVDGVLQAAGSVSGTLAGLPFETQITNFALRQVPDDPGTTQVVECSILDLELGPINLDLLGLHVNTSEICLEITATQGQGLLGSLLCNLAGGALLGNFPTASQVDILEEGLVDILNRALGRDPSLAQDGNSVCEGECEILELVLGPLNLSIGLLGVNVRLDDCNDGPVQVCVSATRGEGILGDLLCGLAGPLLGNLTLDDVARLATRALDLFDDGSISGPDRAVLTTLLRGLVR